MAKIVKEYKLRESRKLTDSEVEEVLKINRSNITATLLQNLFGKKGPFEQPRFRTNDYFWIKPNTCSKNKKEHLTTIGIFIFNRFISEPYFSDVLGYINKSIDGKTLGWLENQLASALLNDKTTVDAMADYYDHIQWLGGGKLTTIISPSSSPEILRPDPTVEKRKAELLKKFKKEIATGDAIVGAKIEKELLDLNRKKIENSPAFDNFKSKAKASYENNFKTMSLMKGPLPDSSGEGYRVVTSNYNQGISKEEFHIMADSSVGSAHAKAINTAFGGYQVKKYIAAFQNLQAGEKDTDCGTKEHLEITILDEFKFLYIDRYVKTNKGLVILTPDNIDQFVGKPIKLRSPMFCHHDQPKFCNKCVGEGPYKLGMPNFGLSIQRMPSTLLNASLKKMHDVTVKIYEVDPTKLFHVV